MKQNKLEGGIDIFSALMSFIFLCNIKRASYFKYSIFFLVTRVTHVGKFIVSLVDL